LALFRSIVEGELSGELIDGVNNSGSYAGQGLRDWYKLGEPTFRERNLRRHLCLCLKLRLSGWLLGPDNLL
jgi:hypothetical protein